MLYFVTINGSVLDADAKVIRVIGLKRNLGVSHNLKKPFLQCLLYQKGVCHGAMRVKPTEKHVKKYCLNDFSNCQVYHMAGQKKREKKAWSVS